MQLANSKHNYESGGVLIKQTSAETCCLLNKDSTTFIVVFWLCYLYLHFVQKLSFVCTEHSMGPSAVSLRTADCKLLCNIFRNCTSRSVSRSLMVTSGAHTTAVCGNWKIGSTEENKRITNRSLQAFLEYILTGASRRLLLTPKHATWLSIKYCQSCFYKSNGTLTVGHLNKKALRNVGTHSPKDIASHPRRPECSCLVHLSTII
jgi:hypothetical protein